MIESRWIAYQVPLSDDRSLIADFLKKFWKSCLRAIKATLIVDESVFVAVPACQDDRSRGAANGIGDKTIFEKHSFTGNAINIWRLNQL